MILTSLSRFFLYLVPFSVVVVYVGTLFPFIVGKGIFMRTAVELSLIFAVWAWAQGELSLETIKKKLAHPLVIAVAVFAGIIVISGFTGVNPSGSFWSNFERGEGGWQIIHYALFFMLAVVLLETPAMWRRMFINSLWAAGLMIAYGLAAAAGWAGFIGPSLCERFQGSLGNSAYVGTYLIFIMSYAGWLLLEERKLEKRWLLAGALVVFFCFLLLNQTRGAFLGFGVGVVSALGYVAARHPFAKTRLVAGGIAIALIAAGVLAVMNRQSINMTPFCKGEGGARILDFRASGQTFQTRLLLWEKSIEAFKERPLLGWGPENFSIAFEKYFDDPNERAWFDRAHNIFFDYLVFSGIVGLMSFIAIFAIWYWRFFTRVVPRERNRGGEVPKKKNEETLIRNKTIFQHALLFAVPLAYLVQGLVLFDVLPIYINLFIFLGFAVYISRETIAQKNTI